ncbi:MAG: hypothetical protein OEM29_02070 [Thermoplasmata archaeon]|nr:hypothetical protein [Thermoplasmata archaeon]
MDHDESDKQGRSGSRHYIAISVIAGMVLFVTGFAITLACLPDDAAAETLESDVSDMYSSELSDSSDNGLRLLAGLMLSMVGVVVATVIPAATFICRANRDA